MLADGNGLILSFVGDIVCNKTAHVVPQVRGPCGSRGLRMISLWEGSAGMTLVKNTANGIQDSLL